LHLETEGKYELRKVRFSVNEEKRRPKVILPHPFMPPPSSLRANEVEGRERKLVEKTTLLIPSSFYTRHLSPTTLTPGPSSQQR